jgi:uncharacterized membrane protein YwzB
MEVIMIGALIGIIFTLILLGVVWWACQQLLALIPLSEPFATIVRVLMIVVLVLIVLYIIAQLLGVAGINVSRNFRLSGEPSIAIAALSATSSRYLSGLLKEHFNGKA